jgi:hypothetical protein
LSKHWFAVLTQIASGIVAASQFSAAMALDMAADRYAALNRRTINDSKVF